MVLFGASGHAKVVMDCLESTGQSVSYLIDDDATKTVFKEKKVIRLLDFGQKSNVIVTIGDNMIRKKIVENNTFSYSTAIHSSAIISKSVKIGLGSAVIHNAIIQSDTTIGMHCIINTKASIDHDCIIDNYVHIAPGATLCGNVSVGECTLIGAGATVIPGVKIGKNVIVGAGSVVINDIPDYAIVVGNPAKAIKQNELY